MKHEISFRLLSEYLDGACSAAERLKIEAHIARCDSCGKTLRLLRNSDNAVKGLGRERVSASFDREFRTRLEESVRLKEERWLEYSLNDIMQKVRARLVPSMPGLRPLAALAAMLFLAIGAHGALNYLLVEPSSIAAISGDVAVYEAKSGKWAAPQKGFTLAKGDVVEAKKGAFADIAQPGGLFTVRVKENSRIKVAKLLSRYIHGTASFDLENGKILASVDKKFKGSRFVVRTPEAIAVSRGTCFIVDVSRPSAESQGITRLGVFEGIVEVKSLFRPGAGAMKQRVDVNGGEATEVIMGAVPTTPRQLLDKEWGEMAEFYKIGKRAKAALLISDGPRRVRELLRPCALYISDIEPRTVSQSLEETISIIDEAIKTKDRAKHIVGIQRLEAVLAKYPNPDYEPQILLFIGSYYNYLGMPDEAIATFRKVMDTYPDSSFASMAAYAIGILYDEKIQDKESARHYYSLVLKKFPGTSEAEAVRLLLLKKQ